MKQALSRFERRPATPILITLCEAVEALYQAEEIGGIKAEWDVLESSPEAAVAFRDMMARRRRWAVEFETINRAFEHTVIDALTAYVDALPEYCFIDWSLGGGFEIPVLDVIEDPAGVVDRLFMLPYTDTTFRFDLFKALRELCATNALIASGYRGYENIREVQDRIKRAPELKGKTGAESLQTCTFRGSPLRPLLDIAAYRSASPTRRASSIATSSAVPGTARPSSFFRK